MPNGTTHFYNGDYFAKIFLFVKKIRKIIFVLWNFPAVAVYYLKGNFFQQELYEELVLL